MECVEKQLKVFIQECKRNENLSVKAREMLDSIKDKLIIFGDIHNLTDLCNPQNAFWKRTRPDIKDSRKLTVRLNKGTRLHLMAQYWFQKLPDFITQEGVLDGAYEGIPRIRGRFDCKIGESIIEIKTKDNIPDNVEEIFQSYPQDLEQVSFYSVMDSSKPKFNYLVYMSSNYPYEIKAFKVTIKEPDKIKELLTSRRDEFDESLKNKDSSNLGKCRYYNRLCEYGKQKICNCESLSIIPVDKLKESVEVEFDNEFTEKLNKSKEPDKTHAIFSVHNIISPRKALMEKVMGIKSGFDTNEVKEDRKFILNGLVKRMDIKLDKSEYKQIDSSQKDLRINIPRKWVKIKDSKTPNGEIIPYVIQANPTYNRGSTFYPHSYKIAELGIICAMNGKSRGLIFTIFPNLDNFIQVYEIYYKNDSEQFRFVRDILDKLERADKMEDIFNLPPCLVFKPGEECPLMEECHKEGRVGCLSRFNK